MADTHSDKEEIREEDLLAWIVSFVVTLGLHVGIALFLTLAIALVLYALASAFAGAHWGVRVVTGIGIVVSLTIWAALIKQQARGFRPHTIRGLGRIVIKTSGYEWGEIAGDIGSGLLGLGQSIPVLTALLVDGRAPERTEVFAALIGSFLAAVGWGSFGIRTWLHRRRRAGAGAKPTR
jgi:hypothetical protein